MKSIALNLDDLGPAPRDANLDLTRPRSFAHPFQHGHATERLVDQWQLVHDSLLDLHTPLPIPCSFLLDPQGRLVAIYKGPLDPDQLLDDVRQIGRSAVERRRTSLPFAGRWSTGVREHRLLTLALALLERGWLDEARDYVRAQQSVLAGDPEFHVLLYNLGQEYTRRNELDLAQAHYREALRRKPGFAPASYNLGILFARAGQFDAAVRYFSQTVDAAPDDAEARLHLGRALLRIGRLNEARACLQEGLDRDPKQAAIGYELAVIHALTGSIDQAIRSYREAIAQDGQYAREGYLAKFAEAALLAARSLESSASDGSTAANAIRTQVAQLRRELARDAQDKSVP